MKRILKATLVVALLFSVAFSADAQKFGYVDSQAILADMPEVKQADANLEALQKQLQKKGQGMVEKLQQDYAAVQQKVVDGLLSPQQQETEAKKLEERQMEIAKFEQDMVNQIQNKRNELLEPIYKKVNDAISAVAKENGYQMIFEKGVLLYSAPAQDV
ncbi:MAG: OmpH family outer membrane protein, partial [Bacteroidetes bacterium]